MATANTTIAKTTTANTTIAKTTTANTAPIPQRDFIRKLKETEFQPYPLADLAMWLQNELKNAPNAEEAGSLARSQQLITTPTPTTDN
ncbi:unnamed protein product [Adineta steineri]|uniref:Uncharacterized protein n=1 Tax=Adineta steineri TaxID=433720 RepID=A0A815I1K7_9BILA|nr:unnamed protein product [Adineta steineri]CAF4144051.1 unnamed protein product [Adineta steineri]